MATDKNRVGIDIKFTAQGQAEIKKLDDAMRKFFKGTVEGADKTDKELEQIREKLEDVGIGYDKAEKIIQKFNRSIDNAKVREILQQQKKAAEEISEGTEDIFTRLNKRVLDFSRILLFALGKAFTNIRTGLTKAVGGATTALFRNIFRNAPAIEAEGRTFAGRLVNVFGTAAQSIIQISGNIVTNVARAVTNALSGLGQLASGAATLVAVILTQFTKGLPQTLGLITAAIGGVLGFVAQSAGAIATAFATAFENIVKTAVTALSAVTALVRDLVDVAVQLFEGLLVTATRVFESIARTAGKAIGAVLNLIGRLTLGLGAATIAIGVLGANAEKEFARSFGLIGENFRETTNELKDFAAELPNSLPIRPVEVARGAYQTLSAGLRDAEEAQTALTQAVKVSISTNAELATVIAATARIRNTFNQEAQDTARILDTLVEIENRGIITVGELANNLGKVSASAGVANFSLRSLAASLATLSGVLPAEEAITALNRLFTEIIRDGSSASSRLRALGVEVFDLTEETKAQITTLRAQVQANLELQRVLENTGAVTERQRRALAASKEEVKALEDQIQSLITASTPRDFNQIFSDILALRDELSDVQISAIFDEQRAKRALNVLLIRFQTFLENFEQFGDQVAGATERRAQAALDTTFQQAKQVFTIFENIALTIQTNFGPAIDSVFRLVADFLRQIDRLLKTAFASDTFKSFRDGFVENVQDVVVDAGAVINRVLDAIVSFGSRVASIFAGLRDPARGAIRLFTGVAETIRDIFAELNAATSLEDALSRVGDVPQIRILTQQVRTAGTQIRVFFFELIGSVTNFIAETTAALEPFLLAIIRRFEQIVATATPFLSFLLATGRAIGVVGGFALSQITDLNAEFETLAQQTEQLRFEVDQLNRLPEVDITPILNDSEIRSAISSTVDEIRRIKEEVGPIDVFGRSRLDPSGLREVDELAREAREQIAAAEARFREIVRQRVATGFGEAAADIPEAIVSVLETALRKELTQARIKELGGIFPVGELQSGLSTIRDITEDINRGVQQRLETGRLELDQEAKKLESAKERLRIDKARSDEAEKLRRAVSTIGAGFRFPELPTGTGGTTPRPGAPGPEVTEVKAAIEKVSEEVKKESDRAAAQRKEIVAAMEKTVAEARDNTERIVDRIRLNADVAKALEDERQRLGTFRPQDNDRLARARSGVQKFVEQLALSGKDVEIDFFALQREARRLGVTVRELRGLISEEARDFGVRGRGLDVSTDIDRFIRERLGNAFRFLERGDIERFAVSVEKARDKFDFSTLEVVEAFLDLKRKAGVPLISAFDGLIERFGTGGDKAEDLKRALEALALTSEGVDKILKRLGLSAEKAAGGEAGAAPAGSADDTAKKGLDVAIRSDKTLSSIDRGVKDLNATWKRVSEGTLKVDASAATVPVDDPRTGASFTTVESATKNAGKQVSEAAKAAGAIAGVRGPSSGPRIFRRQREGSIPLFSNIGGGRGPFIDIGRALGGSPFRIRPTGTRGVRQVDPRLPGTAGLPDIAGALAQAVADGVQAFSQFETIDDFFRAKAEESERRTKLNESLRKRGLGSFAGGASGPESQRDREARLEFDTQVRRAKSRVEATSGPLTSAEFLALFGNAQAAVAQGLGGRSASQNDRILEGLANQLNATAIQNEELARRMLGSFSGLSGGIDTTFANTNAFLRNLFVVLERLNSLISGQANTNQRFNQGLGARPAVGPSFRA